MKRREITIMRSRRDEFDVVRAPRRLVGGPLVGGPLVAGRLVALAALLASLVWSVPSALAAGPPGRARPSPAEDLVGHWQGSLSVGGSELRVVFHIRADDDGGLTATLDSPDQGPAASPWSR